MERVKVFILHLTALVQLISLKHLQEVKETLQALIR